MDTTVKPSTGRGPPLAADGSVINEGDTVLVVAKVLGAAGPVHDLPSRDTGVVALELHGYDAGRGYTTPYIKACVPPSAIARVVPPGEPVNALVDEPAAPGLGDPARP